MVAQFDRAPHSRCLTSLIENGDRNIFALTAILS